MLHWKNWPYWVRGGVIGGILGVASLVITNYCAQNAIHNQPDNDLADLKCVVYLGPGFLLTIAGPILLGYGIYPNNFEINCIIVFIWIIAGSLTGLIWGIIKRARS
jgi:hypothetical protein